MNKVHKMLDKEEMGNRTILLKKLILLLSVVGGMLYFHLISWCCNVLDEI